MLHPMPRPCAEEIALALAAALPRDAARRDEIVAVGMVATALIAGTAREEQAELVETFCTLLKESVRAELN
jgi:hypothetical protein